MSDNLIRTSVEENDKSIIKKQVMNKTDDGIIRHQVLGIGGEPVLVSLNATSNGEYTPEEGIDGFSSVLVDVDPQLTNLVATENGTYRPEEPFNGYSAVVVNVPASLPNEYLESEFDLTISNSTDGFVDQIKKIRLATNKYRQFANSYIIGRSGSVMMGYTNQGDIKRIVVKTGVFDRTVETGDQLQTLFSLISNNNHYTIRWDNTNERWQVSDASGGQIYVDSSVIPKYGFENSTVEIVLGAKYIDGELYRGIKVNDTITTDFSCQLRVYINGVLKIETPETFTGDTLNTIAVVRVGGNNAWVGAKFDNVKVYNVLNCYDKYYENVNNEVIPTAKTIVESEV